MALILTALRGLFLMWFLEAWLRRVMHQPLMMRLLAMLALPVGQGLLVRGCSRGAPTCHPMAGRELYVPGPGVRVPLFVGPHRASPPKLYADRVARPPRVTLAGIS